MALQLADVAGILKIIMLVTVIVPAAGHVKKQTARDCGGGREKTLGLGQHPGFVQDFHGARLLPLCKMDCWHPNNSIKYEWIALFFYCNIEKI